MNYNLVEKIQSYYISSNPANGARDIQDFSTTFTIDLDSPLGIPREAITATLEVPSSYIPYISPNISENNRNNHLYILWNAVNYDIVIPDGLYGVSELNAQLNRLFSEQAPPIPTDTINITGDDATQRVIIVFGDIVAIDFTQEGTPREILGFDSVVINGIAEGYATAQNSAQFAQLTSFQLSSTIVNTGISVNLNRRLGVIANIPIQVSPGSWNNHQPFNPDRMDISELIGANRSTATFRLRDQNGEVIDLFENHYNFTIVIRYMIPSEYAR